MIDSTYDAWPSSPLMRWLIINGSPQRHHKSSWVSKTLELISCRQHFPSSDFGPPNRHIPSGYRSWISLGGIVGSVFSACRGNESWTLTCHASCGCIMSWSSSIIFTDYNLKHCCYFPRIHQVFSFLPIMVRLAKEYKECDRKSAAIISGSCDLGWNCFAVTSKIKLSLRRPALILLYHWTMLGRQRRRILPVNCFCSKPNSVFVDDPHVLNYRGVAAHDRARKGLPGSRCHLCCTQT